MTRSICLNADLGELPGPEGRAIDADMLRVVTRCNIACGGHAGDVATMRETLLRAKASGVEAGAHPSYPDTANFGRVSMDMSPDALFASLVAQVSQLMELAAELSVAINHLKPHGALYNDAAKDGERARIIADVTRSAGIPCLIGPPQSRLEAAARAAGLNFLAEGFADRTYELDGSLTPRTTPGSVIEDTAAAVAQALRIARSGEVDVRTGGHVPLAVQTLCLHSDTRAATEHARDIRSGLEAAGIAVRA